MRAYWCEMKREVRSQKSEVSTGFLLTTNYWLLTTNFYALSIHGVSQ
jgi:hypothetical protein